MRTYDERCAYATTQQGLDPVVEALAGFGVEVEQTGGFTMVAVVTTGDDVVCVTDDTPAWTTVRDLDGGVRQVPLMDPPREYSVGVYTREAWHETGDEATYEFRARGIASLVRLVGALVGA